MRRTSRPVSIKLPIFAQFRCFRFRARLDLGQPTWQKKASIYRLQRMIATGQSRKKSAIRGESALPLMNGHRQTAPTGPFRAMCGRLRVGKSFFHILQHWSAQPCVRPFDAVHRTAGHNALRGSGPGQQSAFDNAMARVGCPDRRIDRLCITCCSPSQPSHHAGYPARSRYRASATGSLYRSPLAIMAQTIRAILLASATAATLAGFRASRAVSQGRCLVPWILA
jgi:hypothetical protein